MSSTFAYRKYQIIVPLRHSISSIYDGGHRKMLKGLGLPGNQRLMNPIPLSVTNVVVNNSLAKLI